MNMSGSFVPSIFLLKTRFSLLFQQHHLPFWLDGWISSYKKCQRFLIKVSNIGIYKTNGYTKANTMNSCNIYVVLCLRNIHFYYILYHVSKRQNIKVCFNHVLCTVLILFLTNVKWFLRINKSWIHHLCFCVSGYQVLFHRRVSALCTTEHFSSPLCMW